MFKHSILITIESEVKMIRNCLIINVMFIQNDTLWVIGVENTYQASHVNFNFRFQNPCILYLYSYFTVI